VPPADLPPSIRYLLAAWALLVGAAVGSFLNVVIARLPSGLSLVRPRSHCPGCGTPIRWYDNIPIVSWLALRARCRSCGKTISWRYPLVEALGAAAAGLAFVRHGLGAASFAELVLASLLIVLAFIDLDTWLLPHALTGPLFATGLVASAFHLTAARGFVPALVGAAAGGGAFWLVSFLGERVFRKEAMGLGDAWLLAGIGAWMGYVALLPIVLLASLQGAVVGAVLLALGKGQPGPTEPPAPAPSGPEGEDVGASEEEVPWIPPRHSIPFGPFLALGTLEWLYLAEPLARTVPLLRPFV
jgi:leader peptidase (prepilin peptidase)/N-methyltransferase